MWSVIARLSAGKTDITWMMLDAGAETDAVNSVGRTAAQMAAFVGMSELRRLVFHIRVKCFKDPPRQRATTMFDSREERTGGCAP